MTNTIRITNTLTQQAGSQATISTNLHTYVCVYACVAGWELAAAGRAKRVCKVTAVLSLCSRRQTLTKTGAKANKLDKCILCIQGTPVTHTDPPSLHTLSCWFFTTLCCVPAAGRAIKTVARSVCMPAGCSYYRLFKQNASSLHRQAVSFSPLLTLLLCSVSLSLCVGNPFMDHNLKFRKLHFQ